jgi:YHS domain
MGSVHMLFSLPTGKMCFPLNSSAGPGAKGHEERGMRHLKIGLTLLSLLHPAFLLGADAPVKRSPKEALQAFNDLIGSWRATGEPEGTRQEKQRGFWTESLRWRWQFKKDDAWLKVAVEKGKYFTKGELRYVPDRDLFQLTMTTVANETLTFEGRLKEHVLTLEREDETKKETQRLILTLLHGTRFLYRYEVKPPGRSFYTRVYQVGATKEGIAFAASGNTGPECVVSGGLGTIKVSYKGDTYYFCCTGCRDAFNDDPEKYIREYQAKKANRSKEKAP